MNDRSSLPKAADGEDIARELSGRGQFLRFCVVGTVGFVVDVAVLYGAVGLLGWYVARVLSFIAAVTVTWGLNRRFTFAPAATCAGHPGVIASVAAEYCKYVGSMLGGALVNYTAYVLTLGLLHGRYAGVAGVAVGSIAGLGVNFGAARLLVFRR